jgi:hypothetical protein
MDFIERLFGVSPDAGNGLTEVAIVAALFAVVGLYLAWKVSGKRRSSS